MLIVTTMYPNTVFEYSLSPIISQRAPEIQEGPSQVGKQQGQARRQAKGQSGVESCSFFSVNAPKSKTNHSNPLGNISNTMLQERGILESTSGRKDGFNQE